MMNEAPGTAVSEKRTEVVPHQEPDSAETNMPKSNDHPEALALEAEPLAERTAAFFAAPRAAALFLDETIQKLIESLNIQRGLVDISTVGGVRIACVLKDARVPFELLDFGQGQHYLEAVPDALLESTPETDVMVPAMRILSAEIIAKETAQLRDASSGTREMHVGQLGVINANVVLIPAMVGPDEKLLDFTEGSLLGALIGQLENAERDFILVDSPERGLRAMPDGSYQRSVVHVGAASPSE